MNLVYMPSAMSQVLLWKSLQETLCNIYANMHALWIWFLTLGLVRCHHSIIPLLNDVIIQF